MDNTYIIIKYAERDQLTLENYLQDDWETSNRSDDGVWAVLKFRGELPSEVQSLSQYRGPYNHIEILSIIGSVEWRAVPEWMKVIEEQ